MSDISVGVAAFVMRDGKFLLGKRIGTSVGDGWYGMPGGHIDKWETIGVAAAREVKEETGIDVVEGNLDDVSILTTETELFPESGKHYVTSFVVFRCPEGVEPVNTEPDKCEDWQWIDVFDEVPNPHFPSLDRALKILRSKILRHKTVRT
jgi:8-oxo-dGTP diphosphatase